MRIAYTSDLHIDVSPGNRAAAAAVAGAMRDARPDAVIVAGDGGNTIGALDEALSFFEGIGARRFFVSGNHDVWIESEGDDLVASRAKYERRIPAVCARRGFHDLGREPAIVDGVAFVGSPGWYDYSFADPRLGLAEEDYWRGRRGDDIWWDKKMTYWVPARDAEGKERMRDPDVCREMCARLDADLRAVGDRAKTIIAVIHTLPFFVGIPRSEPPYYLDAYTGSSEIGGLLLARGKISHCIHGHKHSAGDWEIGGLKVVRRPLGRVAEGEDIEARAAGAVGLIEV